MPNSPSRLPSGELTQADLAEVAREIGFGQCDQSLKSVLMTTPLVRATVSIGAAQHLPGETMEQLLARADSAVYVAKRGGRNQVRVPADEPVAA